MIYRISREKSSPRSDSFTSRRDEKNRRFVSYVAKEIK